MIAVFGLTPTAVVLSVQPQFSSLTEAFQDMIGSMVRTVESTGANKVEPSKNGE